MTIITCMGYGEIGKSWGVFYKNHGIEMEYFDLLAHSGNYHQCEILHVAIPYVHEKKESFYKVVADFIISCPNLKTILLNSTAAMGTTRGLADEIQKRQALDYVTTGKEQTLYNMAHVPVRGNHHPDLSESIQKFRMYVGPINGGDVIVNHLRSLDIDAVLASTPETTELAKVMCTNYYATNVAYAFDIANMCKELNVDFDLVYTDWNTSYNEGYGKLGGWDHVHRPVLKIDKDNVGKIGGHCLVPNGRISQSSFTQFKNYCWDYFMKYE